MKRLLFLSAFMCLCAAGLSCGTKNAAEPLSGEIRFRDLPAVHAPRAAAPSTETFLSITIGFFGGELLEREIVSKEELLVKAAGLVGSGVEKEDLSDIERYEKIRERLRTAFNGALTRPAVVKVIIRDIKIH